MRGGASVEKWFEAIALAASPDTMVSLKEDTI